MGLVDDFQVGGLGLDFMSPEVGAIAQSSSPMLHIDPRVLQASGRFGSHPAAFRTAAEKMSPRLSSLIGQAQAKNLPSLFLNFDTGSTDLAAATSSTQNVTPNVRARITRLSVDDAVAPFGLITALSVGRLNLMMNGNAMPCTIFAASNTPPAIETEVLYPGVNASITILNRDAAGHRFTGSFIGVNLSPGCG